MTFPETQPKTHIVSERNDQNIYETARSRNPIANADETIVEKISRNGEESNLLHVDQRGHD